MYWPKEIVEDLEAALEQFRKIATDMSGERVESQNVGNPAEPYDNEDLCI